MNNKKKIVITGASGGIGSAIARRIAGSDTLLVLQANQRRQEAENLAGELRKKGADVYLCGADFTLIEDQRQFGEFVLSKDPDVPLCSLINAAGLDLMREEIKKLSFDEKLDRILETDLRSAIRLSKMLGPAMKNDSLRSGESGTILFFGWSGIDRGMEGETAQIYSAVKGAMVAFMRSFAYEMAPEVRCCSLSPGWIRTSWGDRAPQKFLDRGCRESLLHRWGSAEEIASAVHFLISREAGFINGQNITVDGGFCNLTEERFK
ncbi:MAG: SDR family oxidoreductase [Planctomycetia bacterium]|nr:SDR family oxidoreductase [Planctomycetia bacterium]